MSACIHRAPQGSHQKVLRDTQTEFQRDMFNLVGLSAPKKELPPYMREMGAICQIGVFTWKPCTFWAQNRLIFGLFALRFQWLWPKSWFSWWFHLFPNFNTVKIVIFPSKSFFFSWKSHGFSLARVVGGGPLKRNSANFLKFKTGHRLDQPFVIHHVRSVRVKELAS